MWSFMLDMLGYRAACKVRKGRESNHMAGEEHQFASCGTTVWPTIRLNVVLFPNYLPTSGLETAMG